MVLVMAVPADGAITFARMLYFLPSRASVRVRPVIAAFAVEYYVNVSDMSSRGHRQLTLAWPKLPSVKFSHQQPCQIWGNAHTYPNLRTCCYNATVLLLLEYRPDGFRTLVSWEHFTVRYEGYMYLECAAAKRSRWVTWRRCLTILTEDAQPTQYPIPARTWPWKIYLVGYQRSRWGYGCHQTSP